MAAESSEWSDRAPAPDPEHGWRADDLARLPDNGLRYELIDGVLVVSAGAVPVHGKVLSKLGFLMFGACPADLQWYGSSQAWRPSGRIELQPDAMVMRRADELDPKRHVRAPVLAVEVLSPSTRRYDLGPKRAIYEENGVASYWMIDPYKVTIHAYELAAGGYELVRVAANDEIFKVERPFPVEFTPVELVDY